MLLNFLHNVQNTKWTSIVSCIVYYDVLACGREYEGPWDPPCPWTGPFPVRYWSFNTADGLVVFSGSVYLNPFLHLGKVKITVLIPPSNINAL